MRQEGAAAGGGGVPKGLLGANAAKTRSLGRPCSAPLIGRRRRQELRGEASSSLMEGLRKEAGAFAMPAAASSSSAAPAPSSTPPARSYSGILWDELGRAASWETLAAELSWQNSRLARDNAVLCRQIDRQARTEKKQSRTLKYLSMPIGLKLREQRSL